MPIFHSLTTMLLLAAAVAFAAAITAFASPAKILPLQRAFPLDEPVELSELRARDSIRHARILLGRGGGRQSSIDGVVNFPVQGSSDPFLVG